MSSRAWAIIGGVGSFVRLLGWRVGFGLGVLVLWELAAGRWIDPFWFSASPWIVAALKVGVPFSLIGARSTRISSTRPARSMGSWSS